MARGACCHWMSSSPQIHRLTPDPAMTVLGGWNPHDGASCPQNTRWLSRLPPL